MNGWKTSTSYVRRWAALCAILGSISLVGCGGGGGASGSSSAPATTTATAAAADSAGTDPITFTAGNFSVAQSDGSASVTVARPSSATSAATVNFTTADGTAVAGTDYTAANGTLSWAENDSTAKTITVPISSSTPFSGERAFSVVLTNPTGSGADIGNPGATTVTITGGSSTSNGSVELSDATYSVAQNAGTFTVTVNRTGGSSGAVSVAYNTADGTAIAGTDYTATSGVLEWADGDASSKTFPVPMINTAAYASSKTFSVTLSNARSGVALASPTAATVTIVGSSSPSAGIVQLSAGSYTVAQSAGMLNVAVSRQSGSSGAVSVSYGTSNGSADAGADFTPSTGTLSWASGDTSTKNISVPITNGTPFSGSKAFQVVLANPSSTAAIGNPGAATVTINGDASTPTGRLELSGSTYSVAQGAGSVNITVNRTGGSNGAASVHYATTNGTAVAGTDFTAASGTVQWASGDSSAKTVSVPVSNSSPFSGTRSFTITLSNSNGASLGNPTSASVAINGDAPAAIGSLQLAASAFTVGQSAGSLTVAVYRTGGSSGAISVHYATADGTAAAGVAYTATSGTLSWADGDGTSKTFAVPISSASPFTGTKTFSIAISNPTSGATLSSPNTASVTINGSAAAPAQAGGVFWVYHNGVFNWPGDYSWDASINYQSTAGSPLDGAYDVAVTITSQYGGWQPYAFPYGGTPFDTSPYKYLIYSLKPTLANQVYSTGFDANNDVADGSIINIVGVPGGPAVTKYGPTPVVGQWGSYKIPIADFALTNPLILKFSIADGTGNSTNLFYVDDVGFTTE
jgi:hypothetical protein